MFTRGQQQTVGVCSCTNYLLVFRHNFRNSIVCLQNLHWKTKCALCGRVRVHFRRRGHVRLTHGVVLLLVGFTRHSEQIRSSLLQRFVQLLQQHCIHRTIRVDCSFCTTSTTAADKPWVFPCRSSSCCDCSDAASPSAAWCCCWRSPTPACVSTFAPSFQCPEENDEPWVRVRKIEHATQTCLTIFLMSLFAACKSSGFVLFSSFANSCKIKQRNPG